ncbi:MAG TPA: XdhC family protein, partial [Sinorhizobium sp.]|nr:XdhC family protein [Sinorhizobium sp.]
FQPDCWTGAILTFHDHDWEPPLLKELVKTTCFYIGAIGSRTVHANRLQLLASEGVAEKDLARIRGPIGLVPDAKSCASLAVGVVAEFMAQAKANNFTM